MKKKQIIGWSIFVLVLVGILLISLGVKDWDFKTGVIFFFQTIILENFLGVNALLLGAMTLVGYLIMKRGIVDSIIGALKTVIGVLILAIGSGVLISIAEPIFKGLQGATAEIGKVVPLDPYLGWASSNEFLDNGIKTGGAYVSWVSFALLIGFAVNIVLVALHRWTNVHTLMVTGHIMFQQTAILTAAVYLLMFRSGNTVTDGASFGTAAGTVIFTGLSMGIYWGVSTGTTLKATQRITNNANFAVGHQQMFGAAIAYKIGGFFGNASDSAETKKLSSKFKLFEDNIFTQSLIILILFFILIMIIEFATPGVSNAFSSGVVKGGAYASWLVQPESYWVINFFLGSLKLVGSVLVIVMGVRMFVTELQQAFQGISTKLIPGAVVAVDVAATYGFAPNSVTYGFISGVGGQFAAVGISIGISSATGGAVNIVIPLFITLFFNSGTMGVFANASGGWKASIIVPFIFGFAEILVISGGIKMLDNAYNSAVTAGQAVSGLSPVATGYIGMFDWNMVYGLQYLMTGGTVLGGTIVFSVYLAVLLLIAQVTDNTAQSKPTKLQDIFKFKLSPQTVNMKA